MGMQQWFANMDSMPGFTTIVKSGTAPDPVIEGGRLKVYGSFANNASSGIETDSSVRSALMQSRYWVASVRAQGIAGSGNFHVWRVNIGWYDNRYWYILQRGDGRLVIATWSSSEGEIVRNYVSSSITTPATVVIVVSNVDKAAALVASSESTGSVMIKHAFKFSSSSYQTVSINTANYSGSTQTGGCYFDDLHVVAVT